MRIPDEMVARLIEMGFLTEMISRAVDETGGTSWELVLETLCKYPTSSEASSSNSQVRDQLIGMGFDEELVIKAIHQYGDENIEELTNVLVSYTVIEKLGEDEDVNINEDDDVNINEDDDDISLFLSSDEDEEDGLSSCDEEDKRLKDLIKMNYPREDAAIAIERCGESASLGEIIDFIGAAQLQRDFDKLYDEKETISNSRKRRAFNELPRSGRRSNTAMANDQELIRLPNQMIGFGVPNEPGLMTHRPVPIPVEARGPPYFYYENIAMAPKGVWSTMSSHLYGIMPEFVDSKFFCAAARKRGYIHNLPIKDRFQIEPPPHKTIGEAFPSTVRWWPSWDVRNCLLTCMGSAQLTNRIRVVLDKHDGEPPLNVKKAVLYHCRKWNLIWVGENRVAPLEAVEMEELLGYPRDHTRGVCSRTDRYKSLGNSFQVETVAYHLSVLKPMFPNGINVLSLFSGIGGAEVALSKLQIPMNVVVSVEISEVNKKILRHFWRQTDQRGTLREYGDVRELSDRIIEQLMKKYGAFDLVIGGSPCNNLAGGNRHSRTGLEGEHSSLFYEYCRIFKTVRRKSSEMRRYDT